MFVAPRQPPKHTPAAPRVPRRRRAPALRLLTSVAAAAPLIAGSYAAAGERSLLVVEPPPAKNVVYLPPTPTSEAYLAPDSGAEGSKAEPEEAGGPAASLWMLPPQEMNASVAIAAAQSSAMNRNFPSLLLPNASQRLGQTAAAAEAGVSRPPVQSPVVARPTAPADVAGHTAPLATSFPSLLGPVGGAGPFDLGCSVPNRYAPLQSPMRFTCQPPVAQAIEAAAVHEAVCAAPQPYHPEDFAAVPIPTGPPCPADELRPYYGKYPVPAQRPWVELWRPFYGDGIFPPAVPLFSDVNPLTPQLTVYGDWRAGLGVHDVAGQNVRGLANQLNLEADLRLTGTERLHAFTRPTDHNGRFTRFDFSDSDNMRFDTALDMQLDAGFFEGDLGAMWGGMTGQDAPFDLPIAAGLMPMVYQNGVWMEDAAAGVAVALPWRHSRALNWSNYDATFFAILDQLTTPALAEDNSAAQAFGTAWFIEAYDGYIEADYAFVHHAENSARSYHNSSLAYTRRYFEWMSNSVRVINNSGQQGAAVDRTADGTLILLENLFRTEQAATVIPYANLFYGIRRPQSVGRAAGAGGILRNTGINFDSDNLTGYPTLDPTGANAYGGALGLNMLTADFRRQVVLEVAALEAYGDRRLRNASGQQYAVGGRFQQALSNWTLVRFDMMYGWLEESDDLIGTRGEWRWKF